MIRTARQSLCVLYPISDSSVPFDFAIPSCIIAGKRSSVYLHKSMGNESFSHA